MMRALSGCIALMLLFSGCQQKEERLYELSGPAQGTSYHFSWWGETADRITQTGIDSILAHVNESLSTYQNPSVINLFNGGDQIQTDNPYFIFMVRRSRELSQLTDGSFDPTVMPLVKAWGFGPDNALIPKVDNLDSLMALVGMDKIEEAEKPEGGITFSKQSRTVQLDFNAIAQGYTVDLLAEYFNEKGIHNYLIELGGEALATGENAKGEAWTLGIEKPVDLVGISELAALVDISGVAIATSGNYRKFYEKDGVRYSHTIDPATGRPVTHSLLSVTVIAEDCATADALATAFMVMGTEKAQAFIADHPEMKLAAYFISSLAPGNYEIEVSEEMESRLVQKQ